MDSFFYLRIHFEFTICDVDLLETCSLLLEFTMSSLLITQIHHHFCHYRLHEFTMILYQLLEFTMDLFPFSRIYYEFTIYKVNSLFFVNKLWIHYRIREFTINSLPVTLIYYEFILSFAN